MDQNNSRPITDEDRRLAESKELTINPAHIRVVADDVPDEQIATNHLVSPPIANAPNDTEQNSRPVQPSPGSLKDEQAQSKPSLWQRSAASLLILSMFIVGGIVTGVVFFFVQ